MIGTSLVTSHGAAPIPLPEAKGKVFYGWFDNHLCYISSLVKFVNDERGGNGKKF